MKKYIIVIITLLLITIIFLKVIQHPVISFDKSMLLNNQNSFEIAADLCIKNYKENAISSEVWIYSFNSNSNNLFCNNNEQYCNLTQDQKQAFITIKSIFQLDHQNLDCIYVVDDFVAFGIVNGRASFIYSINGVKPSFVNRPDESIDNIYIEKIDRNWYYACRQS